MNMVINTTPLTQAAFADFGEVIEPKDTADKMINQGNCGRHHDLAAMDFIDGKAGISLFQSKIFSLPFKMDMMERHPEGSQAFIPMAECEYLVVVAQDNDGVPSHPIAFVAQAGQAINITSNVWHGVLCPLSGTGLFAVVDRIGGGKNLAEHWFIDPLIINQA